MCKQWQTIFLDSKITADGDGSHEIKRHLLLGRKVITNLDSILKNRDYFANKNPSSQGYGFPVVMYGCESLTIKKAEHRRIDAFELRCYRRLLRVPWTARRSNQSILKEISPEYPLEGLMLKLKLQNYGHLMQRTDSLPKTLILEKTDGRRSSGQLDGFTDLMVMSLSRLWELLMDREAWDIAVHGVAKNCTWPCNLTVVIHMRKRRYDTKTVISERKKKCFEMYIQCRSVELNT